MSTRLLNAIWIHQFDAIQDKSVEEIQSYWNGQMYVKAIDGLAYMHTYDSSPLAVVNADGGGDWVWQNYYGALAPEWKETKWIPWSVPTGISPVSEGKLHNTLNTDSLILDLEPYRGFWQASDRDMALFMQYLDRPYDVTIDYRRLYGFPPSWVMHEAGRILPQCYWTDFGRPWKTVLQDALNVCKIYVGSVEMVLPGNAVANDLRHAILWCKHRNLRCSIWAYDTVKDDCWQVVKEFEKVEINV